MKTPLPFSILFFAFAIRATSQITITQADMPQAGDMLRVSITADSAGLPTPALTGQGITWDYSALTVQSQTVDTFLSVSSTSIIYQVFFNDAILYPADKATVAQSGGGVPAFGPITVTGIINYYKDETANYESVGYGANINGIPASVRDNNIDVIYNFPMKYGNADSCHSNNALSVPTIVYYGQTQYRINHVEGWGKLITPFGTFSTLKVKTILYSTDSLYLDTLHIGFKTPLTEQIEYKWLANGEHIPVLEIDETKGSRNRQYIYRDGIRNLAGVNEVKGENEMVKVYPNPSKGVFTLQSSEVSGQSSVEVYNVLGEKVYSQSNIQNSTFNINLSSQPASVYLYRVLSENGSLIGQGKLVVER